ncbi:Bacterial regulatory proteins, tetR family [Falsiruegeria litorea R37]|uniref:Bacterial regulatory proteins, tetR family n=1 Tax=Falsiruegeria litorea R37 TaxID=1200284 RepID=A0A1Y5TVY9_9RHOB|nr:TetR/AcrR family transcriptional regulator [Falsiruegeria litorea]SLN71554.1 Bacterial regulatory proteins, tetR family [Falsiruegeria litorea R37]
MQMEVTPRQKAKILEPEGFSVADVLEERARKMEKRRKRVRTRAALLAVAAREIEQVGYDSLTMDHLANAAGMVRGTLYLYYHSRADIVKAVLRKYWALMRIHRPRGGGLSLKESIHRANTYSVLLAAKNPRLLEAREILLREDPEVAARMATVNRLWSERIISDLTRRGLMPHVNEGYSFLRLKTRAVINMSDTLLSDVHRLSGWDDKEGPIDLDLVIQVMDDLWYRSLYLVASNEN